MVFQKEEEDIDLYDDGPGRIITFTPVNGPEWLKEVNVDISSFRTGNIDFRIVVNKENEADANLTRKLDELNGLKRISNLEFLPDRKAAKLVDIANAVSDQSDFGEGSVTFDANGTFPINSLLQRVGIPKDIEEAVMEVIQNQRQRSAGS